MKHNKTLILIAALLLGAAGTGGAQVTSSLQTVTLNASRGGYVNLSAPSPATQGVTLVDGSVNTYSTPFDITVSWDVPDSATTKVRLVAYFTTPAQALANGTDYIPAGKVEISAPATTGYQPVTSGTIGGIGTASGSLLLYESPATSGTAHVGTQSVTFSVQINLTGTTTVLGTYSGTLNLTAICF